MSRLKYIALAMTAIMILCSAKDTKRLEKIGWGDTDTRYPQCYCEIKDISFMKPSLTLSVWKGEETYAQALVCSPDGIESLQVNATELKTGKSVIPSTAIISGFVDYVMTDELNKNGCGGCGARISTDFDSSYVADPIDYSRHIKQLKQDSVQPVWFKITVPRDIASGRYSGKVIFTDADRVLASLELNLNVSERTLPVENDFHLDLWQNPYAVARYYNVNPFTQEHFRLMRPIMQQYADAGGKVITASIMHKPWNGQTYDPFDSMVTWLKKADGTWYFDYTVFDMWVEFMMSLGIDRQINCYSMIPWRLSFRYLDQANDSFKEFSATPGKQEFKDFWTTMLRSFSAHLREKGWFDITMIAMDERPMKHMRSTIEVIKEADPEFKISFAGNYHEELQELLDYYCIPMEKNFPDGIVEKRRKEGKVTTWYTSCAEAWPNTFTFSMPAEAEWMGWYIAAGNLDGYLRWALNSWTEDPINDSRFRTWAAGDTYLLYPDGISSIRFERLKAGITAYRKVAVLRKEASSTGNMKILNRLNKALSLFVMPDIDTIKKIASGPDKRDLAAENVNAARKIIADL